MYVLQRPLPQIRGSVPRLIESGRQASDGDSFSQNTGCHEEK